MAREQQIYASVSSRLINWLTSLMPAMEGLFLITVLDGRKGRIVFRCHESTTPDVMAFLNWMATRYSDEFQLEETATH